MIVKCGRVEFELNHQDMIMYNGACYQLVTRKVGSGWNAIHPILAKSKAEKLIKSGQLVSCAKAVKSGINLEYYNIAP
jgi:hypothetical protein